MYKISVILPVYNVEKTIEESFQSILNQSIGFSNLEVIFVDDCSTDNSPNIIKEYTKKYPNVKYYKLEKNSGVGGKPRNLGLSYATSDYVMFLDPDDTYYPNACETLYINILNNNVDILSGNYTICEKSNIEKAINLDRFMPIEFNSYKINNIRENYKLLEIIPAVWAKIYKKSFLLDNHVKFLEYVPAEDLYFVIKALLNAKGIMFIDEDIVHYQTREDEEESMSITSIRNSKVLQGYAYAYNKLYELLHDFNPKLSWIASSHLYFGTIQLAHSDIDKSEKLEFIYHLKELYKVFMNCKFLKPFEEYNLLFNQINNNQTTKATDIAEYMSSYILPERNNEIKTFDYYILTDNYRKNKTTVNSKAEYLIKQGYNTAIFNIDITNSDKVKHVSLKSEKIYHDNIVSFLKIINITENNENLNEKSFLFDTKNVHLNFDNEEELISYYVTKILLENPNEYVLINEFEDNDNLFNSFSEKITTVNKLPGMLNSKEFLNEFEIKVKKAYYTNKIRQKSTNIFVKQDNDEIKKLNKKYAQVKKNKNNELKRLEKSKETKIKKLENKNKTLNRNYIKKEKEYENLETTNEYYKSKSIFSSIFSYLYIIYKHENISFNLKLHKHLQKTNWFDVGYYLNQNDDLSHKKWCKILTPHLHYIYFGFKENRKVNPNDKHKLAKEQLLELQD